MQPATIGVAVELGLAQILDAKRHIPAQLPQELHAAVADDLRGIIGAAEYAAAIAALLGDEQRIERILPIGREQQGELCRQRLQPGEGRLELAEIERRV